MITKESYITKGKDRLWQHRISRVRKALDNGWIRTVDLIYPRRCPMCLELLPQKLPFAWKKGVWSGERDGVNASMNICMQCQKRLPYVKAPMCFKCGKPLDNEEEEYCQDCIEVPKAFDKGFPVFSYHGVIKDSVMAFKYHNKREFAAFYVDAMMDSYGEELKSLQADACIPVPVHRSRYRKRGYNQAQVLAMVLAGRLKIPCYPRELVRVHNTSVQKKLNDKERKKNVKKAFKRVQNGIKLRKVILVDDIYTSGATVDACARVLKETGVQEVYYTSVCIGKGY